MMDPILRKLDVFKRELTSEVGLLLNQRQLEIIALREQVQGLSDAKKQLEEEKAALERKVKEKEAEVSSLKWDKMMSGLRSKSTPSPKRPHLLNSVAPQLELIPGPVKIEITDNGNHREVEAELRLSNGHQQLSTMDSSVETYLCFGDKMTMVSEPDSGPEQGSSSWRSRNLMLCLCCKTSPVCLSNDSNLCSNCFVWQHSYCIKAVIDDPDNEPTCIFCHFLENNESKEEIAMDSSPKGAEKHPKGWNYYWNFILSNGMVMKVGDCVYVERCPQQSIFWRNEKSNWYLFRVTHLYIDEQKEKHAYGFHYFRAIDTMYKPSKRFFLNEVFEVSNRLGSVPVSAIRGFCAVLKLHDYKKGKPRLICPQDVYICEQSYYYFMKKAKGQEEEKEKHRKRPVGPFEVNQSQDKLITTKFDKLKQSFNLCLEDFAFEEWALDEVPSRAYFHQSGRMIKDDLGRGRKRSKLL